MRKYFTLKNLSISLFCFLTSFSSARAALTPIPGVPDKPIADILDDMVDWIIGFGVMVCVLMLIWGGITYVGSFGSQETAQRGKKAVTYAILGLLIIGLSYAIIVVIDSVVANP